jgi:uncharacterized DUF497 family protein
MIAVEFEWDPDKAASNERKHAIPFPIATRVFLDGNRLERRDARKDYGEERWITIGLVDEFEIVVVYTLRIASIRIISARRADRDEREAYWDR